MPEKQEIENCQLGQANPNTSFCQNGIPSLDVEGPQDLNGGSHKPKHKEYVQRLTMLAEEERQYAECDWCNRRQQGGRVHGLHVG
jgi:hypothetical protein